MLIDTHAHLNFSAFKADFDEVIKRALSNEVWLINVGSQYETSKRAVEIAQKYNKGVYAAVGLHPIHLEKIKVDVSEVGSQPVFETRAEEFNYENYKKLAQSEKVVAIGEIGLDYWYKPKTKKKLAEFKERQKEVFLKQLNLAEELKLPLIFHCRLAHADLLEILKFQVSSFKFQGVIHCFTGTWEQAQEYLKMGLYLGFNGLIFKLNFDEIIEKTPLEKILIETDCPYLPPPQHQGERNEPLYVKFVAEKIAKIKNLSYDEIAEITTKNAKELFKF